jgi:hypothetical protein
MWATIMVFFFIVIQFLVKLLGGFRMSSPDPYSHYIGRGRGPGFESQHMMHGLHHGQDFSWIGVILFLLLAFAVATLLVRWLRKKGENDSLQQFIMDTPLADPNTPVNKSNADLLDKWEKNQTTKKENE